MKTPRSRFKPLTGGSLSGSWQGATEVFSAESIVDAKSQQQIQGKDGQTLEEGSVKNYQAEKP